jgi:hypothetical protein
LIGIVWGTRRYGISCYRSIPTGKKADRTMNDYMHVYGHAVTINCDLFCTIAEFAIHASCLEAIYA